MQLKGTTNANTITFPIQNAGPEKWLSVRSSYSDGTAGRRALAINWPGGLFNCPQPFDLGLTKMVSPAGNAIVSCGQSNLNITIQVRNEGLNPLIGALAAYQINNDPPISEALPNLQPGEIIDFNFQTPVTINTSGVISIKTWVAYAGDFINFNDTINRSFQLVVEASNQFFTENFEAAPGFPNGWVSINPDERVGWNSTDDLVLGIVGPDDLLGRALYMDFYRYGPNLSGAEDYLYMIPVDLAGLNNPQIGRASCRERV